MDANPLEDSLFTDIDSLGTADTLAVLDTIPKLTARDTIPVPDSLRFTDPFRYKYYVALRDRPWIPSVAHVRLEENACVRELCFGDSAASSGTWGSSESSAEHVDDVHFEGPGVLTVGVHVSLMILR